MACGCNGVSNGTSSSVLEVNSSTLTSCGAPQCTVPADTCSDGVPAGTPVPYYMQAPSIQQTNCQQFISQQFSTVVKTSTAWNVPVCGGTASATFNLPNVTAVLVGSNLWNESYGYFEVIAWNAATQMVTVANNCVEGNVAAGTPIPACTEFLVGGPVCGCSSGTGSGTFVAIDFTAPPASTCINITVTSIEDLVVGKSVQIGTGIYRVSAVLSNEIITICNDGSGITPGTAVIAKNGAGDYQYPITLLDTNPCTNPAKPQGALLVCDGSGLTQPLDGAAVGMIPVLVDATSNAVEFQALDVPTRHCTYLTTALTLAVGIDIYVLNLADGSGFVNGQKLQIGSRSDRFTVAVITSSTQITVRAYPVPTAIAVIPIGTTVCEQYCCDEINDILECLPQKMIGSIPVDFDISSAITFGPLVSFEERIADGTDILRITVPEGSCPDQQYRLTAEVSLYALTATDSGIVPALLMHEMELAWVVGAADPLPPRTEGKMAWVTYGSDQINLLNPIPPTPPSTQAGLWTQLVGAQIPGPSDRAIEYNGGVIRVSRNVVAGEVLDLALIYKVLLSQSGVPVFTYPTQFMWSGIWELVRI